MDVIIAWRRQQLHCSIQVSERERVFLIVAEIQVGHCIRCLVREHIDGRFTSEGTSHAVIDIERIMGNLWRCPIARKIDELEKMEK